MKNGFLCFVCFCCFVGSAGFARAENALGEKCIGNNIKSLIESDTQVASNYSNAQWGYSVDVPAGFVGLSNPPESPQHGFGIVVSADPVGYVWVDGSSNVFEFNTSVNAAYHYLGYFDGEYKGKKTVISSLINNFDLGGLTATRIRITYDCPNQNGIQEDIYFAISSDESVTYEIGLVAEKEVYAKCEDVMEQLLKTWKVSPRSRGDSE